MKKILFLTLFFFFAPISAHAHPHAWIDMETTVLINKSGKISGVRVGWLFDDFYSAFSLEGVKVSQMALDKLAQENLKNLADYDYFTDILVDGLPVAIMPVTQYNTSLVGKRLWLEFDVELVQPVDPKKVSLTYSVYDPTYYVEILHAEKGDPVRIEGGEALGCGYQLENPEAPEEIYMMASGLDKDETAGDGIGKYFAQKVSISCK